MSRINNISFSKKPISIPVDYRPLYKISQLCLILKYTCIGNKSSLLKLHLISWSFKSSENHNVLWDFISKTDKSDLSVWGIEPTLNRALQLAVAYEFCSYQNGNYKLEEKGIELTNRIESTDELFTTEIEQLKNIGKKGVTEKTIQELAKKWTLFND